MGPIRPATGFCPKCELTMGLRVVRKGNQNNNSLWLVKNDMKLKSAHKRSDWNVVRRSLPWQCPQRPCVCGQKGAGPCPGHRWMCPPCPAPPCVPIGAPHPPLLLGTCVRPVSLSFCAAGPRRLPAESLRSPALAWEGALARPPLNVLWSRESGWTGVSVHGLGAGPGCCRATGGRKCLSSVLRPLRPFTLGDPPPFLTFLSSRSCAEFKGTSPGRGPRSPWARLGQAGARPPVSWGKGGGCSFQISLRTVQVPPGVRSASSVRPVDWAALAQSYPQGLLGPTRSGRGLQSALPSGKASWGASEPVFMSPHSPCPLWPAARLPDPQGQGRCEVRGSSPGWWE